MNIKIQKYQLWLAFFFFIFGMTFSMIVWTVKSAVNTPVYEDKSFMTSYQDVDENYNQMVISNAKFNNKYHTEVNINGKKVGMELNDLLYGQRSLEKKSTNQNMLLKGDNKISVSIKDKKSNTPVTNANVKFQITRAIADMDDINLDTFKLENNTYSTTAKIEKIGHWNIIAKITIADDVGYLYIKTNTKK